MSHTNWQIDPLHSYIELSTFLNGESPFKLYFRKMAGKLRLAEDFENSELQLHWLTDSLDSGDRGLDKFLTSSDFFSTHKVPQLKFVSGRISKLSHTQFGVRGTLHYGDHEEPISFNARYEGNLVEDERGGEMRTGLYLSTQVEPSMFAIKNRELTFDRSMSIELDLEFVKTATTEADSPA